MMKKTSSCPDLENNFDKYETYVIKIDYLIVFLITVKYSMLLHTCVKKCPRICYGKYLSHKEYSLSYYLFLLCFW